MILLLKGESCEAKMLSHEHGGVNPRVELVWTCVRARPVDTNVRPELVLLYNQPLFFIFLFFQAQFNFVTGQRFWTW